MNPSQKQYFRSYPKKQYTPKSKQDMELENKVRSIVRAEARKTSKKSESKMHDYIIPATAVDYTGVSYNLTSGITQGSNDTQYVGANIRPSTLRIRFNIVASDTTNLFRVVVIQLIGNGTPTTSTLFQSVTNVRAPLSPFERDYIKNCKVLYDELFSLALAGDSYQVTGDVRIPYTKFREIFYRDASGTIEANGLYILFLSDSAAASHPVVQAYSRLYYKDC